MNAHAVGILKQENSVSTDTPTEYCRHCNCESCWEVTRVLLIEAKKRKEREEQLRAKQAKKQIKQQNNRDLVLQEAAMIWLLVNTADGKSMNDAQRIIFEIAQALDITTGAVNQKRQNYVIELERRTKDALDDDEPFIKRLKASGAINSRDSVPWAKVPGSRGSELPKMCGHCGEFLTPGGKHKYRKRCR